MAMAMTGDSLLAPSSQSIRIVYSEQMHRCMVVWRILYPCLL